MVPGFQDNLIQEKHIPHRKLAAHVIVGTTYNQSVQSKALCWAFSTIIDWHHTQFLNACL